VLLYSGLLAATAAAQAGVVLVELCEHAAQGHFKTFYLGFVFRERRGCQGAQISLS
jgi:hypothetical protein